MAERKVTAGSDHRIPGIRAAIVAHLRKRLDVYDGRADVAGRHLRAYLEPMIAALESGAAVRVPRRSIPLEFSGSLPPGDGNTAYIIGSHDEVSYHEQVSAR